MKDQIRGHIEVLLESILEKIALGQTTEHLQDRLLKYTTILRDLEVADAASMFTKAIEKNMNGNSPPRHL